MKKRINKFILIVMSLFLCSCAALDNIGKATTDFLEPVPQNVKTEAMSKVNLETELYGIGSAPITESGISFALSKASADAKNNLKEAIAKESGMVYNSFIIDMEAYMKKIYTPVIPDLTSYTVEKVVPKLSEKGNWSDEKRAYVLVTAPRSEVLQESKNALTKYTVLLQEQLSKVKGAISGVSLPANNSSRDMQSSGSTKNIEDFNIDDEDDSSKDTSVTY